MSGGPSKVLIPKPATGVKASVRASAPKVAKAPPHKAPQSGYESADKKGIRVAAALIRVVGEFFAPLEKQWGAVKEAAEKIADVIEEGVIDPLVAGAVAVYEGVKAAAEKEHPASAASEKGTQKAALSIAPAAAAAAVVGGVAVIDGCGVVPSIVGVTTTPSPLIPLQFLSTWGTGTVGDGGSPASSGSGVKASTAGKSSVQSSVSLNLTDPGDNAAAAAKAVYGHAIGDASRSPSARAATDDTHTAGDAFTRGAQGLFADDHGRTFSVSPTHIATPGSDQDDIPWYHAAAGGPRPGESVDIIREAFRRANGAGHSATQPDVATDTPVTERPSRAAIPSYRGGGAHGHESSTITASGDNSPVKDRDAQSGVGYEEHAFALPLPIMTSGGAGGTHVSMGPSDGDRIEATLEGGHARRDDAEGGGGSGSQSSQHDDDDPEAFADTTDPDIWIG